MEYTISCIKKQVSPTTAAVAGMGQLWIRASRLRYEALVAAARNDSDTYKRIVETILEITQSAEALVVKCRTATEQVARACAVAIKDSVGTRDACGYRSATACSEWAKSNMRNVNEHADLIHKKLTEARRFDVIRVPWGSASAPVNAFVNVSTGAPKIPATVGWRGSALARASARSLTTDTPISAQAADTPISAQAADRIRSLMRAELKRRDDGS